MLDDHKENEDVLPVEQDQEHEVSLPDVEGNVESWSDGLDEAKQVEEESAVESDTSDDGEGVGAVEVLDVAGGEVEELMVDTIDTGSASAPALSVRSLLDPAFWTGRRIAVALAVVAVVLVEGFVVLNGWVGVPSWALDVQSYGDHILLVPLGLSFLAPSVDVAGANMQLWSYSTTEVLSVSGDVFSIVDYDGGASLYDMAWWAVFFNNCVAFAVFLLALSPVIHVLVTSHCSGKSLCSLGRKNTEEDQDKSQD